MLFRKFSRRTFLTASSAFAFLHAPFAYALSARQNVNISDYNPHNWVVSFEQVFNEGQTIVVPDGLVCDNVNTGTFVSPGKTLRTLGSLCDNGRGQFILQGGSQAIREKGDSVHNITLDVHGSDYTIKGLTMSDFGPVAQIYIGGKNKRVMCSLTIDNLAVSHANYATLRQGFHSQIIDTNITNCKFSDLQGDTIEWNAVINDRDILISDHATERINHTNDKINRGIGIGLARSTYDGNHPEDQIVKNFVMVDTMGSNCWQLIHVEDGKHFAIHNTKARNIAPDFSKKAGIDNATVAIYGCDNFVIDNTEMTSNVGMLTGYRVIKGKYLSILQDFRVDNIQLDNAHLAYKLRDIRISVGNVVSFVTLTNIEMKCASLELHNRP